MHVGSGQYTNTISTSLIINKLLEETPEIQVARQDSRYRGPEEGKDAKRTYSIEACTAKIEWPCYKNARWAAAKESFLWKTAGKKALTRCQKKRYKDTLIASLKGFNIPTESCKQAAQDRTKWRCLNNKGVAQFESKRICEAETKRKEQKARAKDPPLDSAQSEFTCSICNRQFRAKMGLHSHQREHNHTWTLTIWVLRWSFSILRDEQSWGNQRHFLCYHMEKLGRRMRMRTAYCTYIKFRP